jgi:hypothetical protein
MSSTPRPPVSDKTKKGMSLNIDDRAWIKRSLDEVSQEWNDAFDKNISELSKALAEIIQEQNNKIFAELEKIHGTVDVIMKRLDSIEARLDEGDIKFALLERYTSLPNTIVRLGVTVLIGIGIGFILHSFI